LAGALRAAGFFFAFLVAALRDFFFTALMSALR
jgi:hypothetical protein